MVRVWEKEMNKWRFVLVLGLVMIWGQGSEYCSVSSSGVRTCYACYYRCKDCSGVGKTECISCLKQYIYANSTCMSCGDNCYSCKKINDTPNLNSQNIQSQCETCIEGYYLSQSSGKCIKCPTGAQTCTLSAIQACLNGFYQSNGVCLDCQQNCLQCLSSTKCQTCQNYFFLDSSGNCSLCQSPRCLVCDSSNCLSCDDGFSGPSCSQVCPENCAICYSGLCFVCKFNFYMSNNFCLPNNLFCQIGSSYGQCDQCISELSYLSDTLKCIPFYTVHDENRLIYLTAINDMGHFWSLSPQQTHNNTDSISLLFCQSSIAIVNSMTKSIYVSTKIEPSYKIIVKSQLMSQSVSFDLSVFRNQQILSKSSQSLNNSYGKACNGENYYLFNYGFEFDLKTDFNSSKDMLVMQFALNGSGDGSFFGMSEIYLELYRCQIRNCLMCKSAYTCQGCIYPFRLQNNECMKSCEEGYYLTESDSLSICTLDCLKGYFAVRQDYTCQKCQWPCIECEDINKCLRCYHFDSSGSSSLNQSYFLFNSTCVKECPDKYYADVQTYSCEECIFPCSLCSSVSTCNTCRIGYLNSDSLKCVLSCPQSQYADFNQLKCKSCSAPCTSCEYSPLACTSCAAPFLILKKNDSCISSCPKDYTQVGSVYCSACKFPCKACQTTPFNCSSCIKGYFLDRQCFSECPKGYYKKTTLDLSNICDACQNNCMECQDESICSSCKNDFWYNAQERSCVTQCPKGTYHNMSNATNLISQKRCIGCVPPCLECSNQTYCLSCTGLLFLNHLGQCLLQCPRGTYIFYNTLIEQRQCMQCASSCLSCVSTTNCYECKDGFYLWQGICDLNCPSNTFSNQNGYKYCEACYYPCIKCINQYQCLSCVSGFLYQVNDLKCVEFCTDGFLENTTDSTCLKCNQQCETCTQHPSNCATCASGYFFDASLLKCTIKCPDGTFYSLIERKCRNCQWPCRTCLSFTTCSSCYQLSSLPPNLTDLNANLPYILYLGHCLSECPEEYVQVQSNQSIITCMKCTFPCQDCSLSSKNCTKCRMPSVYLIKTSITSNSSDLQSVDCMKECVDGYYLKNQKCELCYQPCKRCSSRSYCIECITDWYLLEGECYQKCPYHFYATTINSISVCEVCSDQCKQCLGNPKNCTSCSRNYYLLSPQVCVRQCPAQLYPSSKNMDCLPCQIPCLECYSETNCKTCQTGLMMQESKCVSSCDSKHYLKSVNSNFCTRCQSPCQKCKSTFGCLSCLPGFYYLDSNFSCVRQCPSKMYGHRKQFVEYSGVNQSFTGVCLQCSQLCNQCSSYSVCLSCNRSGDLKYLEQNRCQNNCYQGYFFSEYSNGYYDYNCLKCKDNCVSCTSLNNCLKCFSSYLHQNECLNKCPTSYYASTSYTCEKCVFPCRQCYNQYNCLNCEEGYFLYKSICLERCPSDYWSDIQERKCVVKCGQNRFLNEVNKTCLGKCQHFYSSDFQCLNSCENSVQKLNFINQTLGCQICQFQNKVICEEIMEKLKYAVDYIILNGKLVIVVKFGGIMKVNSMYWNESKVGQQQDQQLETVFNFSYEIKQSIKQQLALSFIDSSQSFTESMTMSAKSNSSSRLVQQQVLGLNEHQNQGHVALNSSLIKTANSGQVKIESSEGVALLVRNLKNSLWIEINHLPQSLDSFSGYLNYQLQQYLKLVSNQTFKLSQNGVNQNLPLQYINAQRTELKSFSPQRKIPQWISSTSELFSKVLSYLIILLILVNLCFDNLKSQFHLIDFTQNIFLVLWITDKIQFGINDFVKGFGIINFIDKFSVDKNEDFFLNVEVLLPEDLWKCSLKEIVYGNSCQFNSSFIVLAISIGFLLLIIGLCKSLIYFKPFIESILKIQHKLIFNHINNFYWLFITPIFYISSSSLAFDGASISKTIKLNIILIIFCGLLSLVLGYQLLKSIFNCSFEEKTFFWGLKCHRTAGNIQSNMHFLLLMIRKSIFMIALMVTHQNEQKKLVFFFLVVLASVILLSNILTNSPFKNLFYQRILIGCEVLGVLFYLGIQIYIVNVKKFNSDAFIAYNVFLLVSVVLITFLHLIISTKETYKILKKTYKKYKSMEEIADVPQKSSSSSESDDKNDKWEEQKQISKSSRQTEKVFGQLTGSFQQKRKQDKFGRKIQHLKKNQSNQNIETEQQVQDEKQLSSRKEQSQTFSEVGFQYNSEEYSEPAKYLIRLQKNPTEI